MKCIYYKNGYKYQLIEAYTFQTTIQPVTDIGFDYVKLPSTGVISIRRSYAWDGPSGPTIDSVNFMKGSLIHDALYQLMRMSLLKKKRFRKSADQLLKTHCIEDGMNGIRAQWLYWRLRIGGDSAASPDGIKPVRKAPDACIE